jgi:hypothetical protein
MSATTPICAYCGQPSSELTRDHVIPRALWGGKGNLRAHVVVVPACRECQQKWDLQAEYFRNTLIAMIDKGTHPVANKVLEGPVIKSLERNEKAIAALFRNPRVVPRKSPGGIITSFGLGFEIDQPRFAMLPEKIVRGLFFHKSGIPLAVSHVVRVLPGNEFWTDEGFQNLLAAMEPGAGCGDDVFTVRCTRDRNDPFCSAWLLVFYQHLGIFAWTERAEGPNSA